MANSAVASTPQGNGKSNSVPADPKNLVLVLCSSEWPGVGHSCILHCGTALCCAQLWYNLYPSQVGSDQQPCVPRLSRLPCSHFLVVAGIFKWTFSSPLVYGYREIIGQHIWKIPHNSTVLGIGGNSQTLEGKVMKKDDVFLCGLLFFDQNKKATKVWRVSPEIPNISHVNSHSCHGSWLFASSAPQTSCTLSLHYYEFHQWCPLLSKIYKSSLCGLDSSKESWDFFVDDIEDQTLYKHMINMNPSFCITTTYI